jgi:hypothetical protein
MLIARSSVQIARSEAALKAKLALSNECAGELAVLLTHHHPKSVSTIDTPE